MATFDPNTYFQEQAALSNTQDVQIPSAGTLQAAENKKFAALESASAHKKQDFYTDNNLVAGFARGSGTFLESIGTLYGLTTGNMDNALRETGANTREFYEAPETFRLSTR